MVNLILYAIPFFVVLLVVEMILLRHVHHHPEDEDEALDLMMGVEGPIGYEPKDTRTSISMGLGGYLAARTDQEHYATEEAREYREIRELRDREIEETEDIFRAYGLEGEPLRNVVAAIAADGKRWVDFMMRFELGLERPNRSRALTSAVTIAASYIVGGLIPLSPYFFVNTIHTALLWSMGLTGIALVVFGAVKAQS